MSKCRGCEDDDGLCFCTPPNKGKGRAIQWIRDHAAYQGDDCLKWPFSTVRGYGQLGYNGKPALATRLMCEIAHGPAPTPEHHAAHSCGRGHEGCTNPRHLSWKTLADNQRDRRQHGTHQTHGSRCKLTRKQAEEIRALAGSMTQNEIASRYGVTDANVRAILSGRSWRPGGGRGFQPGDRRNPSVKKQITSELRAKAVAMLREATRSAGGVSAWAREHNIYYSCVFDALSGRKQPSIRIRQALGLSQDAEDAKQPRTIP